MVFCSTHKSLTLGTHMQTHIHLQRSDKQKLTHFNLPVSYYMHVCTLIVQQVAEFDKETAKNVKIKHSLTLSELSKLELIKQKDWYNVSGFFFNIVYGK